MNIPLLRRIQRQIKSSPEKLRMNKYATRIKGCGTAYCIAGWALKLSGYTEKKIRECDTAQTASQLLEIPPNDCTTKWKLFNINDWPRRYRTQDRSKELPALAVKRIDHFIKTEGRE